MIKLFYSTIFCFCGVLFALTACSNSESEEWEEPFFTIAEEYLQQDFDAKSSSVVIPIKTNLGSGLWDVKSDAD